MLPFTFYRTIHLDCPVFIWRHTIPLLSYYDKTMYNMDVIGFPFA